MKQHSKLEIIIVSLAVMIYVLLSYYRIVHTNLSSDATYHTQFFMQNSLSSSLSYLHANLFWHYGFPRLQQFSLNYPPLYHLLWWILYGFSGEKTAYIIDAILGLASSFLLAALSSRSPVQRIMVFLLSLTSFWWYTAWGNNNIILLYGMIICLFVIQKLFQQTTTRHVVLFIMFSIFWFGTKQPYYFFYPLVAILFWSLLLKHKRYALLLVSVGLICVWTLPLLYREINNTGTVSTQTIQGWPYIDKNIFKPRHFELEKRQHEIDALVDVKKLDKTSAAYYRTINIWLDKINSLLFWKNIVRSSYSILPKKMRPEIITRQLQIAWLAIGLLYLIKKERLRLLNIGTGLFAWILVYAFTSKLEYSLIISLIIYIITVKGLFEATKGSLLASFLLFVTLFYTNIGFALSNILQQETFLNTTYLREKLNNQNSFTQVLELLKTIHPSMIMHSNSQDFPFRSQIKTFWDFRLFFLTKEQLATYLPYYIQQGFSHILITKSSISSVFNNRIIFYDQSDLYKLIKNEQWFTKLYENADFLLYQVDASYRSWSQTAPMPLSTK